MEPLPQRPSTDVDVVVVVVVMVRCLSCDWSRMEVCKEASEAVLPSRKLPLLIGVLAAEKDSVFLGVGAWLRDNVRELRFDCCFLLRGVLVSLLVLV